MERTSEELTPDQVEMLLFVGEFNGRFAWRRLMDRCVHYLTDLRDFKCRVQKLVELGLLTTGGEERELRGKVSLTDQGEKLYKSLKS